MRLRGRDPDEAGVLSNRKGHEIETYEQDPEKNFRSIVLIVKILCL